MGGEQPRSQEEISGEAIWEFYMGKENFLFIPFPNALTNGTVSGARGPLSPPLATTLAGREGASSSFFRETFSSFISYVVSRVM